MDKNKPAERELNKEEKHSKRKTITPYEKLIKRLIKEFPKKKLIGDIIINDDEYKILIDYFKTKCKALIDFNIQLKNDPIFATALVQIGIKFYNGKFWEHVADILEMKKLNASYQGLIGDAFINTLLNNNKIMLDKSERVNNILMHGFVSDYYANEMFDFFFKYYNIDLERDLQRNDADMMNNLIQTIQKKDNTGRTYLLVKQTADAISSNIRGGKIRIRHFLRLIDKCFWEQIVPINPVNRLSSLFLNWQENSSEFKTQYIKYNNGNSYKGKKSFSSPYFKCDFRNNSFKIVLPTQLINFEYDKDVKWNIYNNGNLNSVRASLYQGVTGLKTETKETGIEPEDIFNEFIFELTHDDNRIRLFKIKSDCIRFFYKDKYESYGYHLNADSNLPRGEVYAFTRENETPISEALIENEPVGNLVKSYFQFEYGDIVRLPDGKPISIGKKIEEGLLRRGALPSAHSTYNDVDIPIYSAPPGILLKIPAKKANGTLIEINGNRYRLFEKETTIIDLEDRSGETGYILNLKDYGCIMDDIYNVFVDVPNDSTNRFWQFALINGMSYKFQDAPYIFKAKGTIGFNEGLKVYPNLSTVIKNNDENSYNFVLEPDVDCLGFSFNANSSKINLYFDIPILKWRFDEEEWRIEKPSDIWHSDFPSIIYLKYPEDKIKFSMDEQIDFENNPSDQSAIYIKSKSKDIFECDVTRFKSWIGREKVLRSIFFHTNGNREEFVRVITQSIVKSYILKGDFEASKLIGEFDILGKSNYYVDVIMLDTNKKIGEKLKIINGKFEVATQLSSGVYKVNIYEDEEDDTGFGMPNYLQIGELNQNIINPYDLKGKNILIKHIIKNNSNISCLQLSCDYIVINLKNTGENDKNNYTGKLTIKNSYGISPIAYDVNIKFPDLNKLQNIYLTYQDGIDNLEFLYDTYRRTLVKEEEKGLKRAVKYRRYECLYPEEYTYVVEFTDEVPVVRIQDALINLRQRRNDVTWKTSGDFDIPIEQMGFSFRTYNCLHRAKILTAKDIQNFGTKELIKVRNLGKKAIAEIILKMRERGFKIEDITPHVKENIEIAEDKEETELDIEQIQENISESAAAQEFQRERDILSTSLSEIGISSITWNCLKRGNILTVRDVVEKGRKKLMNINGFNKKMCKELLSKLYFLGVSVN